MNKISAHAVFGLFLPLLVGCTAQETVARWGLVVEVRDAQTGEPAAWGATLIARDGTYADTVDLREIYANNAEYGQDQVRMLAAEMRTGTFSLTITHPEYQAWHRDGVRVRASSERSPFDNSVFPETVHLVAELQPLNDGS